MGHAYFVPIFQEHVPIEVRICTQQLATAIGGMPVHDVRTKVANIRRIREKRRPVETRIDSPDPGPGYETHLWVEVFTNVEIGTTDLEPRRAPVELNLARKIISVEVRRLGLHNPSVNRRLVVDPPTTIETKFSVVVCAARLPVSEQHAST